MLTAPHHLTNSFDFCKAKLIQEEQQQWHNMAPWSVRPPMTLVNGFRHNIFTAQPFHDPRKNHWNQTLHSKRHKDASPVSWGKANIIQTSSDLHWDWQSNDISLSPFWKVGILNGDKVWKDAGRLPCFPLSIFDLGGGSILIWTARFLPVVLSMESTTYVHHNFTNYI